MKRYWQLLIAFIIGVGIFCGLNYGESLFLPAFSRENSDRQKTSLPAKSYFEKVRQDKEQLRAFLQKMPKGGELHTHLSGDITPERLLELAAQSKEIKYFVRVPNQSYRADDPEAYQFVATSPNSQSLLQKENTTLIPVSQLLNPQTESERQHKEKYRQALMISEAEPDPNTVFFKATFARIDAVTSNPEIVHQTLADVVQKAHKHHISYVEPMLSPFPGNPLGGNKGDEYKVLNVATAREYLGSLIKAVKQANQQLPENERVEVRFMLSFRRTSAKQFTQLPIAFELAAANDEIGKMIAGINLVGNEYSTVSEIGQEIAQPDNISNYILTLRRLYPSVRLSIHAGESDQWDWHIRDSILLGAERIGHGVNLVTSPESKSVKQICDAVNSDTTFLGKSPEELLMRRRGILIEACPTSNHLLLKVPFKCHPFKKWLRMGIPVSLNTDDAGIFGTNITEEFAVAVESQPDLSWEEVKKIARASLEHAFVSESTKTDLIKNWEMQINQFEAAINQESLKS
jgi:adenosine deaminase CECR1